MAPKRSLKPANYKFDGGNDIGKKKRDIKKYEFVKEKDIIRVEEVFDTEVLLDYKTDVCALCRYGHDVGKSMKDKVHENNNDEEDEEYNSKLTEHGSVLDINGIWASKYSVKRKNARMFVHFYCALLSPQAWFNGTTWYNLSKEIARGRGLSCKSCGRGGATLGCYEQRCHVVMHVPCALKVGFRYNGLIRSFYCAEHLKANIERERQVDLDVAVDVSRGHEAMLIKSVNTIDKADAGTEIRYTKVNLDSADVITDARCTSALCCQCEGLCDDVATCLCLSQGRNYTFTGELIPGTERRILECNTHCTCSVRRCTNRVVEKGITARLEIFRVQGRTAAENTWGVRTLDAIPVNSFVCEITGQYVLGRTVDTHTGSSVADTILRDAIEPTGGSGSGAGKGGDGVGVSAGRRSRSGAEFLLPVESWAQGAGVDPYRPVQWAMRKVGIVPPVSTNASSSGVVVGGLDDAEEAAVTSRPLTEQELLREDRNYEKLSEFLRGEICIDSRTFGNIGSFLRRAPKQQPNNSSSSGDSAITENKNSSSGSSGIDGVSGAPMLMRRVVFTNASEGTRNGVKLALFAARNIEANTELLI